MAREKNPRQIVNAGEPKHPRAPFVEVSAPVGGTTASVTINFDTGAIALLDASGKPITLEARAVGLAKIRPTDRQLRTLVSIPVDDPAPVINLGRALAKFDTVVAVDATPVDGHAGRHIIVAAQLFLRGEGPPGPPIRPARAFDVHGVPIEVNAEKLAWKLIADEIMGTADYRPGERVAIITDAHLSEHRAVNSRACEALPGWALPPGFELVFAKDKSGSDSPMQKAIHLCDSIGNAFAHGRFIGKIPRPERVAAEPFQAITRWVARGDGGWGAEPYRQSGNR